jgi:hypothetical protein
MHVSGQFTSRAHTGIASSWTGPEDEWATQTALEDDISHPATIARTTCTGPAQSIAYAYIGF